MNSSQLKPYQKKYQTDVWGKQLVEEYADIYHNGIQTEENDEIGDRQKSNYTRIILEF